jgi:hypothetical protein
MKITFIGEDEEEGSKVTLETPEFHKWAVGLFYFQQFLQGCGYILSPSHKFDLVEGDMTDNLE